MIDKTSKTLKSLLLWLMVAAILPVKAKDVYGFMTGNGSDGEVPIGMYKFDSDQLKPQLLTSLMYQFWGGAYVGDKYLMILSDDATGYLTEGLCAYDLDSRQLKLRYAQQPYQCSDLTYDYSTATLYGVMTKSSGEEVAPRLIKIDPRDGSYTKVASLDKKITAIACTYFGDLYAMGDEGTLYEMDKESGELTAVGNTGLKAKTSEAQSMEFDRATGELYWTGLDGNDFTFFCQLDPATGAVVQRKQIDGNALIVGLHIPFTVAPADAPARPQDLKASTGDKGVTLTWTNPSTTYGGATLEDIAYIEVWKNGHLLQTLDMATAGKKMTFTDPSADSNGKVRYIVYAYNEAGRGEGASVKTVTGEDIPGTVTQLTAEKDGENVKLSWTAPTAGKNGGNIRPDQLTYNVTRLPDGMTVKGLKDTCFTDRVNSPACYYTWQVSCQNAAGEGNAEQTQPLIAGRSINPPYTLDFSGQLWRSQWRIVDHNGDGNTWTTGNNFTYNASYTQAADDSLVSVPFRLKSGVHYVVRYDILAPNVYSAEHFRLSLKGNGEERILEDLDGFTTPDFSNPESRSVSFEVPQDGDYQFCMAALSDAAQFMIQISAFSVKEEFETDLAAVEMRTDGQLNQGRKATFKVTVNNVGLKDVSSYTVQLLDRNNQVVAAKEVTTPLTYRNTAYTDLDYTPTAQGLLTLRAVVKADCDGNAANDTTGVCQYTVLGPDETIIEMGGKDYYTDFPFWFSGYPYNYAQAIYWSDEIGGEAGDILQLQYDYANNGKDMTDKPIKVYMANTDNDDMTCGWISEQEMTLVADTVVSFLSGEHTLRIPLHTPFAYTGSNLCIMTQKMDSEASDDIYFYATATDEPRTALYNGDEAEVDLNHVKAAARLNQVRIIKTDRSAAAIHQPETGRLRLLTGTNSISIDGQQAARITVTDLCGKTVARWAHTRRADLSLLAPGVYIVKAEAGGQQAVVKVCIK